MNLHVYVYTFVCVHNLFTIGSGETCNLEIERCLKLFVVWLFGSAVPGSTDE